jgi:hypothetical protein
MRTNLERVGSNAIRGHSQPKGAIKTSLATPRLAPFEGRCRTERLLIPHQAAEIVLEIQVSTAGAIQCRLQTGPCLNFPSRM